MRLGQGHDIITVETAHPHNLNIEGKKGLETETLRNVLRPVSRSLPLNGIGLLKFIKCFGYKIVY